MTTVDRFGSLDGMRRRLVNEFQRNLPVTPRPFAAIAGRLESSEHDVIEALRELQEVGLVSRVGAVIRPNTIGASALAAMSVPAGHLDRIAGIVNERPEVNHNYEREHRFNLWFVVTARDGRERSAVIRRIEQESGLPVMTLPMLDDYYIDLGFDLDGGGKTGAFITEASKRPPRPDLVDADDRRLLRAIQEGLPLVPRPYLEVGGWTGLPEQAVCDRLRRLCDRGFIKRFGVIVRHHECGYRHNAMVVWDVPDEKVHGIGRSLATLDPVRLCYRRPRRRPRWPYNLFCMIHGRDRSSVVDEIERITLSQNLQGYARDILFSVRRFKQRGAQYGADAAA